MLPGRGVRDAGVATAERKLSELRRVATRRCMAVLIWQPNRQTPRPESRGPYTLGHGACSAGFALCEQRSHMPFSFSKPRFVAVFLFLVFGESTTLLKQLIR